MTSAPEMAGSFGQEGVRSATPHRPLLLVVSAPSGAGKTSLCNELVRRMPRMIYSISCTTRAPRGTERDGEDYFFLSEQEFARRAGAGEFIEHAVVHGHRYGTLRRTVRDALAQGLDVLMDLDVQGARQIRDVCQSPQTDETIRRGFVDLFIAPPSMDELCRRLRGRSTDTEVVIEQRMRNAEREMLDRPLYRYCVVNDNFDDALEELIQIVRREHRRMV